LIDSSFDETSNSRAVLSCSEATHAGAAYKGRARTVARVISWREEVGSHGDIPDQTTTSTPPCKCKLGGFRVQTPRKWIRSCYKSLKLHKHMPKINGKPRIPRNCYVPGCKPVGLLPSVLGSPHGSLIMETS